jgi:hypothetical protein
MTGDSVAKNVVLSNAPEPDWVPTKRAVQRRQNDLDPAHRTQVWLAASDDPAATWSAVIGFFAHSSDLGVAFGSVARPRDISGDDAQHEREIIESTLARSRGRISGPKGRR